MQCEAYFYFTGVPFNMFRGSKPVTACWVGLLCPRTEKEHIETHGRLITDGKAATELTKRANELDPNLKFDRLHFLEF